MKLQFYALMMSAWLLPSLAHADAFLMPGEVQLEEMVKPFPQPYVVKKGDTLWDIAKEYFADPQKWLKIWEHNLQVTNPDLIYPGNEIWLKIKKVPVVVEPQRKVVTLTPRIIYKPAEHLEKEIDNTMLVNALMRQDFIRADRIEGVGHIIDSEDERLNYGAFDKVYIALDEPAHPGEVFDIFRNGDPIYNVAEQGDQPVGYLVNHLGRVEITSVESGVYRGTILDAFQEIGRTDRLKPAVVIDYNITPEYPDKPLFGRVLYIRSDAIEAGQGQVLGISLGIEQGLRVGSVLGLYRSGRLVVDQAYAEQTFQALPEEKIGEVIVLAPQEKASIVMVTRSSSSINKGDIVQTLPQNR